MGSGDETEGSVMKQTLDGAVTRWLGEHREEFAGDLLALLAIPSVRGEPAAGRPYGAAVGDALDLMLSLCRRAGLTVADVDGRCGEADFGDGEKTVGVLTHLDVVPAGGGWTRGAWGEAAGDRIYGRGATDDKGPAMACLYALRALIAAGAPVKNRLRLLFGCGEETGMDDMRHYLTRRKAPDYAFSPDAAFPVIHAEKSIVSGVFHADIRQPTALVSLTGGARSNVVPESARAQLRGVGVGRLAAAVEQRAHILLVVENREIFVKSEGVPAHASTPWKGRNAITQLVEYLADVLPEGDGALPYLRALAGSLSSDGAGLLIACRDDVSGPLTFNTGMADLTGGRLTVTYDIRHPVTLDAAPTLEKLNAALSERGFDTEPAVFSPGLHLPCDHPLVAALSRVYARATGRRAKPIAIGGGTYARTLPCAVAFGPVFPGRAETAHMADEYADVSDLIAAARIYALAMAELGNL